MRRNDAGQRDADRSPIYQQRLPQRSLCSSKFTIMKRTLILIGCTMMAALAALIMLVAFAGMPNDRKNGFDRQWLTIKVEQEHSEELPLPAERIFGAGDSLYLSEPLHQSIYRLDQDLHIRDMLYLDVNNS